MTKLSFEFTGHLAEAKLHILSQRCMEYPIHREIVTRVNKNGDPTTSKTFYYVDDPYDPTEYATAAAALAALEVPYAAE